MPLEGLFDRRDDLICDDGVKLQRRTREPGDFQRDTAHVLRPAFAAAVVWVVVLIAWVSGHAVVQIHAVFHEGPDAGAERRVGFFWGGEIPFVFVDVGFKDVPGYVEVDEVLDA
jgi:hypothetical protein